MPIKEYIKEVKKRYSAGISTEHSYRGDLQNLLLKLVTDVNVTNEPKRQECGAPDYIIQRKDIPLGYIEAKDIGLDLDKIEKSDQLKRYLSSLSNLILTDYLEFRFYKYGAIVKTIKIAVIENGSIKTIPENYDSFITHFKDFCSFKGQTIKSTEVLAKMMANKARMMEEVIFNAVQQEDELNTLHDQLIAFREILIHALDEKTFADIYAQTIAYGLFAARLHDKTLDDFSRQEARELIPRSNPFLRNLFDYVSGAQLDERVVWIVDDLADIFRATDLPTLLADFGKSTEQNDPFIHFYETFLAEYDPRLRKSRGVYYTPEPVVSFIVRAVDDILKTDFNLPSGLADTSKIKIKSEITGTATKKGKAVYENKEVHKVQILDPATGTGTFLAQVVRHIHNRFKGQEGIWSNYVEEHLIPRLNGFEILMASYTMCHLKIEMLLNETNYKPKNDRKQPRLRAFLTDSLEEHHPDTGTLFASWLARESTEANNIKKNTPVMVILGNPPYSGESSNKGEWIMNLMEDYKKEPGGIEKLKERNPKWINDDYVKFIRYGQHYIEKNGEGILAFINPHGYLDNPTFRGMRWNLLKTYDKIYTIDLHGNSKKKEVCPDGSPDENVFDIQQGVSINLFIKTGRKRSSSLGRVFHYDLYGKRQYKYDFLWNNNIQTVPYVELPNVSPDYYFVPKDYKLEKVYKKGFSCSELFIVNGVGMTTAHDRFVIKDDKTKLLRFYEDFQTTERDAELLHKKFNVKEKTGWNILDGYDRIRNVKDLSIYIKPISYRPFDNKHIFYEDKLVWRTVRKVMQHFLNGQNVGLNWIRPMSSNYDFSIFISKYITDQCSAGNKSAGAGISYIAPLYLYSSNESDDMFSMQDRKPNLDMTIVEQISKNIELEYVSEEKDRNPNVLTHFAPIDILDYIYAVLHSPSYRKKYKESLSSGFPRVPYPKDKDTFWQLVQLGSGLRLVHLLESPIVEQYITSFPIEGDNTVIKHYYTDSKVWINDTQYFDDVPEDAWNFLIGGYLPAQKWLDDRKGIELNFDDILHYQKIIVALTETNRLMKEIDKVIEF